MKHKIFHTRRGLFVNSVSKTDLFDVQSLHFSEVPFVFSDKKNATEVAILLHNEDLAHISELEVQECQN